MIDLRKHIQLPNDWEWVDVELARLGSTEKLYAMRNAIWGTLLKLPEGKFFDIENSVRTENRALFVKTAC